MSDVLTPKIPKIEMTDEGTLHVGQHAVGAVFVRQAMDPMRKALAAAEISRLQERVAEWHAARFPDATMLHVVAKMAEECGEVASAVLSAAEGDAATGKGIVQEEAADVAITLLVILGRWFSNFDLLAEVERKLAILTDPTSGHPASLPALRGNE